MGNLLARIRGTDATSSRYSLEQWYLDQAQQFMSFNGQLYPLGGVGPAADVENIPANSFEGLVHGTYRSNGIVFACVLVRMMVFGEARFQWQQMRRGRPGDLFGTSDLAVLERPWPNGTTGELLSRAEQDTTFGGNFYVARERGRLRRLRPDWVSIVLTAPPDEAVESDVAGYRYQPGGPNSQADPVLYLADQVTHWSPIPDPLAQYRGMSWVTPVVREVMADTAAMRHKQAFYENSATPQLAVTFQETVTREQFEQFMRAMNDAHSGAHNAYKTLFLGGGADVTVVGKDLQQLDFKASQGHGESRIAAASGVGAVVAQLSEGMQGSAMNAGNYTAARRRAADALFRPQWRSISAALETVAPPPPSARLWYDETDIAFLREDAKDAAEIEQIKASTITAYVREGFTAASAVAAVENQDVTQLEHTGNLSVQLQPADPNAQAALPAADNGAGD